MDRPPDPRVLERMRADWNERAAEDALYYVAFGRRGQDEAEFFASAADAVRALEGDLKRLHGRDWTALEIGCGPGRLMRPMSRHFREIHGVDVSDEMIRLARANLAGIPHAHAHASSGADLARFADESFDFVYSYAVFQHIPSREVVFHYLREARRVLRTGGILRCQINGLPEYAPRYDTWHGVRIAAAEVEEFARRHDFQLLALEGAGTQYMWTTMRKRAAGWRERLAPRASGARIRQATNALTGEPVVPARGRLAATSLWVENLPEDCDLLNLSVRVDGTAGRVSYVGPPAWDNVTQINAWLPEGARTGLLPLELEWLGRPAAAPVWLRVLPPGPAVPRVVALTDGVDLLSGTRIVNGVIKVSIEDLLDAAAFRATIDGAAVTGVDHFCTDPVCGRYEINFELPAGTARGPHEVRMAVGRREFAPVAIEVV